MPPPLRSELTERTRNLLFNRPQHQSYRVISDATGISSRWLTDFAIGGQKSYCVMRVETLYKYLTGHGVFECSHKN